MDRLSDGYLVRTSESLYSVQSMANIRIRLIFDSSNTLVNRLGPSELYPILFWIFEFFNFAKPLSVALFDFDLVSRMHFFGNFRILPRSPSHMTAAICVIPHLLCFMMLLVDDLCKGKFQCDNGQCVDESLVCDRYQSRDCVDGSDEARCGRQVTDYTGKGKVLFKV